MIVVILANFVEYSLQKRDAILLHKKGLVPVCLETNIIVKLIGPI